MKLRCFSMLLLLAGLALSADFSGTWTGEAKTYEGGSYQMVLKLKAEGDHVTGTIGRATGGKEIEEGKIEGDTVTFKTTYKSEAATRIVDYTGKLEGSKLTIVQQIEGSKRQLTSTLERQP